MSEFNKGQNVRITAAHNQFVVTDDVYQVADVNKVNGEYSVMISKDGFVRGAIPQTKLSANFNRAIV